MGGVGSGRTRRVYPEAIVQTVVQAYEDGATIREIQGMIPRGFKAQRIVERHVPARRKPAKRDQRGERNSSWKGDDATYQALHLRVQATRGTPSMCSACERTEGRFEWANLTGDYTNVHDYVRLCVGCHRRVDAFRRREVGVALSAHVSRGGGSNV